MVEHTLEKKGGDRSSEERGMESCGFLELLEEVDTVVRAYRHLGCGDRRVT